MNTGRLPATEMKRSGIEGGHGELPILPAHEQLLLRVCARLVALLPLRAICDCPRLRKCGAFSKVREAS